LRAVAVHPKQVHHRPAYVVDIIDDEDAHPPPSVEGINLAVKTKLLLGGSIREPPGFAHDQSTVS
jgi:hypothetical protein